MVRRSARLKNKAVEISKENTEETLKDLVKSTYTIMKENLRNTRRTISISDGPLACREGNEDELFSVCVASQIKNVSK